MGVDEGAPDRPEPAARAGIELHMTDQAQRDLKRHRRIRWVKTLLRPLPRRATIHRYPFLKRFAEAARRRPHLWSFRRTAMTPAFYAGSILALLPAYGIQIPVAFLLAIFMRSNLATMVGLQMITNPLTMLPVYVTTYFVGNKVVDLLGNHSPASVIGQRAYSLVIGGIVCGLVLGAILDLVYRFLVYEAQKHNWRVPVRLRKKESASPSASSGQKL